MILSILNMLYSSYIKKSKVYEELNRLSDRELQDMGISRSDIPNIAEGKYCSAH